MKRILIEELREEYRCEKTDTMPRMKKLCLSHIFYQAAITNLDDVEACMCR
jgi:hypothetical protein